MVDTSSQSPLPDPRADAEAAPATPAAAAQPDASNVSRRSFLAGGLSVGAALGAGAAALSGTPAQAQGVGVAPVLPPGGTPQARKDAVYAMRTTCARINYNLPAAPHPDNGDEALYPDKIGSYSKGLPHNQYGEVDLNAYAALVRACAAGDYTLFEQVPAGESIPVLRRKQVNPLAGVAYDLEGQDSHDFTMRPAPAFASAEQAGEIVENYWMALLRDIPYEDYPTDPLVQAACADLSRMSDFRGPKAGGVVTPATLFRSDAPGCLVGPYISQFFWRSQPFGAQIINPRMRTVAPGIDFMTSEAEWLSIQNGRTPGTRLTYDNTTQRYMRNGRDLGRWVHMDVLYQAYLQAALHLMTPPDPFDPFSGGGLGVRTNRGDPYRTARYQEGFGTFGGPYEMTLVVEVATRALKAAWYQKWFVHRRLRPEAFAGALHHKVANGRPYNIHSDALQSAALTEVFNRNGTLFLPMAFPEGSPLHPAYAAGHATVAGACVTVLKALFDETSVITNPVMPTRDGLSLVPYTAGQLTVGGELNKLASNVAIGRNVAGVHWRTDASESLRLGEEVAMSLLREQRYSYMEPYPGFTFTRFDGTRVTV